MKRSVWMAVALWTGCAILFPFSTKAEEKAETIMLEEVVVTATKTEEAMADIPNSVIVLDQYDIAEDPAQNLGALLGGEAGVDWRSYGDYGGAAGEIHIRGMSGNGTQVFINGTNINSPSLGVADISKIPLAGIERVEVVKGAGSLLYGSGAMGGTVNLMTKRPDHDGTDMTVRAGCGTENTCEVQAEQGMYLSETVGYYLTAGRRETEGYRDNSDLSHSDVSLNLVFDKGDSFDVSLYCDYLDREYGRPGVKPPSGTGDFSVDGTQIYSEESASLLDRGGDRDTHFILNMEATPLEWWKVRFRGDCTLSENYNYMRYYDAWNGTVPGSETWTTNRVWGSELTTELACVKNTSLLVGADYKDYDWESESISLDGRGIQIAASRSTVDAGIVTKGLFAEAQYRPFQYVKLLAGMRHEDHSIFGYEDIPRFGLVINPLENTALKFSHGRHFKAPTPNDLFWPDDGYTRGNPDLEPETGWHSDITAEHTFFDDHLLAAVSCFFWNIDDKIQWGPDSSGVWTPENLRTYRARGFEASLKAGFWRNMTVSVDYTYTDAEEENKAYTKQDYGWPPFFPPDFQYDWVTRRAAYTPRHQIKSRLVCWTDFGLTATAVARYVGDRLWYRTETDRAYPATKTVEYDLGSYWTLDCTIEQRFCKNWAVTVYGTNLLDEEYDTHFDIFYDNTGAGHVGTFPGAGRSFFAAVTCEF